MLVDDHDVLWALRQACHDEGGQRSFADKHRINETMLSLILNKRRRITKELAKIVGFEPVLTFRRPT